MKQKHHSKIAINLLQAPPVILAFLHVLTLLQDPVASFLQNVYISNSQNIV
jgi:hypothetical protein